MIGETLGHYRVIERRNGCVISAILIFAHSLIEADEAH